MKAWPSIILIAILLTLAACSNTKFLSGDQVLYTGRKKVVIQNPLHVKKVSSVKSYVESVTTHKVNNALFGQRILPPFGLWVHNYMKPKNQNKPEPWFYKTFSSSPVLLSDVNPELRAKNIRYELFGLGYFNTQAWPIMDTSSVNNRKARVSYFVDITPPYHYDRIIFDAVTEPVDTVISQFNIKKQIKSGDQFNLTRLKSVKDQISKQAQEHGYYYFNPDFIDCRADTSLGPGQLDLFIGRKKDLPASALYSYKINDIFITISRGTHEDQTLADTLLFSGITIVSDENYVKPVVLANAVFLKPGELYTYSAYQITLSNLNNLGLFKYVNIAFEKDKTDSLNHLLNVRIDLLMAPKISLDIEANLVTKSSGFVGPALSTGITNNNTFKGAERLQVRVDAGFEWQWGTQSESQLGTYSYELGINSGLTFPKIIIPGVHNINKKLLIRKTTVNLGASLLNRTSFYKMYSISSNLNYQWGKSKEIQHSFFPIYINSVKLLETTPAFDSAVYDNIYIRKSFEEQFIIGMQYEFTFNNSYNLRPNNFFYKAGINTSGNLVDWIAGTGKSESDRPYLFLNNVYAQYLKFTSDFRYYRNGFNKNLVFRLYAGVGIPYGNSTALPYVEQYYSGGAYSIRGFTARSLGPGSFHDVETNSTYIDQTGDLKLESNLEFRFKMSKILNGAFFIETGNIWLINEDPNRPGAEFHFDSFLDQLAVGTGLGLRFDFTFFVLRTDLGFPLRTAYLVDNSHWPTRPGRVISSGLFYLAIGYPF